MVRWVVLGLLRGGESLHGYALVKAQRDLTGVPLNSGNFYRELKRLAGEGLVRPVARRDEEEDPRRMLYAITAAGIAEFDAWFRRVAAGPPGSGEDALGLRSLFVAAVEPQDGRRLLDRWRDELWLQSQLLERARNAELARGGKPGTGGFPARAGLLGRRLRHVAADIEYLEEIRRTYETWLSAAGGTRADDASVPIRRKREHR